MTTNFLPSRVLPLRLLSRVATPQVTCSYVRVRIDQNTKQQSSSSASNAEARPFNLISSRSYATTTSPGRPGRPKAHTGRTTAPRRKPATTASTKADSTSATGTKKTSPTKKKATKAKPGRKAKAKPKPKKKKVLTEKQKAAKEKKSAALKQKELRQTALLAPPTVRPPKRLPENAFTVVSTESATKGTTVAENSKVASSKYKNLTPEELEQVNHTANQNKAKNEAAYKKWLLSYTPTQIKEANNARNILRRQAKAEGKKASFQHIKDDRLVKQAVNAYSFFLRDRVASGDMRHMKISEVGHLVGKEWKALSASERKQYDDLHAEDRARYLEEYKTVYGVDPPSATRKPSSSS